MRSLKLKLQNSISIQAIQAGFELSIPFLVVGAFALLLRNFPVPAYQRLLAELLGGSVQTILSDLYTYTLGSVALLLCLTISASYARLAGSGENYLYVATALASYMGFCGSTLNDNYIFGSQWLFTAMCITLFSCLLFRLSDKFFDLGERLYMPGASYLYTMAIRHLLPIAAIVCLFTIAGYILRSVFGQENITNFGSELILRMFDRMGDGFLRSFLFVLFVQIFWFFGIHGTNVMDPVATSIFEPLINVNVQLVASGQVPTELYSNSFLNTFVFMGGCGTTLSMAIALLFFAKRKQNRRIAYATLPTTLFNVNEIMLFGYPIVFNPLMLIPFVLTPLVVLSTSVLAMSSGLVPYASNPVEWTLPALISGYMATGSIAGSFLQLFNIGLGIIIYIPFIRFYEKRQNEKYKAAVIQMERDILYKEQHGGVPKLIHSDYPQHSYARALASDLKNALSHGELVLYYQPQMLGGVHLYGAEALLRWQHPVLGFISPPLVIELATEIGILSEMTYYLLHRACEESREMLPFLRKHLHLSVNISSSNIEDPDFCERVLAILKGIPADRISPVLELTERTLMESSAETYQKIQQLRAAGIEFSIDDFGMGHNSITLLQEELFDEIKLDGSLITQITYNSRSEEIVSKIVKLSSNLDYRVIAEFVENKEQEDMLCDMGCHIYQGYYYSQPMPIDQFVVFVRNWKRESELLPEAVPTETGEREI